MTPVRNNVALWHLLAIITITFWGTSFVSTKVLLNHGFTAVQVFSLRFAVTYLILLAASHKQFRSENWKHELILFICGITGCTLYFWTENTALTLSQSSNVSLIVCTNPLLIMILGGLIYKSERLGKRQILGCLITFIGMILVVLNGKFILKLSPVGDLLAFSAGLMWATFSLIIKQLNGKYSSLFITRKMFFYGTLSSIPAMIVEAHGSVSKALDIPWHHFTEPVVTLNFLCLTVFSSLFGYLIWNSVLKRLGVVLASNYGYAVPMVTMITATIALGEQITAVAIVGAVAIIAGMVMAEMKRKS
ncbi:Permease of the drug/metabolite transporter (DMT) superfamily [Fibrobacter sp. UWB15]|jgi:drug/metabolite transporter (DMT)-like permease|uniref:DMT family transporter n=1 Tax=unclassified Fibrobacter TaxID=2634177 RepID=UPI000910BF33|nr:MULTISPECIES: DMT family transporter [unclassified Fibrobacter]PWJ63138.1 drug/metabolite transporter (DMT)-like permease [Fibrobacter sp. UWB6]SHG40968.1 Permease of the drug/metabolite transporter (DMT) superfamily [Fibrobacter sp. UWB8]SMG37990.1 Permease of the drug/metabolite transporter (DMT) superfamily [Fibrobacter sp. UWB15]